MFNKFWTLLICGLFFSPSDALIFDGILTSSKLVNFFGFSSSAANIDIRYKMIKSIESTAFQAHAQAKYIDMSGNYIGSIPSDLFKNLVNLDTVNFQKNQIKSIAPRVFSTASTIKTLDLSGNLLTSLSTGVFTGLTALKVLNLDGNQITNIQPGSFAPLVNLNCLGLSNNALTELVAHEFSGLFNLLNLRLDNNYISLVDQDGLSDMGNLITLSLSNNKLKQSSSMFANLNHLTTLDLSFNLITLGTAGLFDGIEDTLTTLKLNNNQISLLEPRVISSLRSLTNLDLANNPLTANYPSNTVWITLF